MISRLKGAENVQLIFGKHCKREAAFAEKRLKGLVVVTVGERAARKMVEKLAGTQAVEPAVESSQELASVMVVGLELLPVVRKSYPMKKLRQMR
jgi:hypothetical protein